MEGKDPAGWYPKLMNAAVMVVSKTRPVWVRRKRKRMKEEGRKREDGQPSDGRWMDGWMDGFGWETTKIRWRCAANGNILRLSESSRLW